MKYIRLPEFLNELTLAKPKDDGSYQRIIRKYTKVELLLILDEWPLTDLSAEEKTILLETSQLRYRTAYTIYCSKINHSGRQLKLDNETIAEAILDRITCDSYQFDRWRGF